MQNPSKLTRTLLASAIVLALTLIPSRTHSMVRSGESNSTLDISFGPSDQATIDSGSRTDNQAKKVLMFISDRSRAYLEVKEENKLRKIFTEQTPRYMAMLVFNESNNPEILKLSFTDNLRKQNVWTIEFRAQKAVSPLGKKLAQQDFIATLSSNDPGFKDWKRKFSSFPSAEPARGSHFIIVNTSNTKSPGTAITDGKIVTLKMKDWVCACKNGTIAGPCMISNLRCALDNLCNVWGCIEEGTWNPDCQSSLNQAKACLAMEH